MIALARTYLQRIGLIATLVLICAGASHAQATAPTANTTDLASELREFGNIDLLVFDGREDFLRQIDEALGLGNIKNPDQTFAKLPRSPFTLTGRKGNAALATCRIFVPVRITPENNTEIFAELMRNWFGTRLNYASNADLTYRWLIFHEVRHCRPDHFGGDDLKDHSDEHEADLFAFDALANTHNRDQLATDIIAFRMITSALIAEPSHMTGLSLKHALERPNEAPTFDAKQEMVAFRAVRRMISQRANSIATAANPTNRELIRAITELRSEIDQTTVPANNPLIADILNALDNAIAHFAPDLHQSVANVRAN
ncbi:hypothetical protein HED22_07480 [Thalassospira sp. HF15]|uniref:hypothetical protein n=1 Tax=Thalassospira sp. HF15 TaxID=2722755 RepID=UPI001430AB20|nr:hypothetical protein [Thalassospira sp. HF15]NIY75479.1 hypothetical protein [Thalassospira sp. HF15]